VICASMAAGSSCDAAVGRQAVRIPPLPDATANGIRARAHVTDADVSDDPRS
jgi:hypothetical protein